MPRKQNKGFTLLEILLVIAAIGILAAIVLVAINPNRQIAQARNLVRQSDINTIQKALEQYIIEKGSYPIGITNTYKEICNTGSNNTTQGTVSSGCIDLRELVPTYIASIPVNPSTSTHSGYYVWINDVNKKIAVLAGKGENGKIIGVNNLKENIVTDGLVLYLDAGNTTSYPGTGNTWFDLSGSGNNGTLVNGVGYNSSNGGSLVFDGVDDYVSSTLFLNTITNVTLQCWVNIPTTSVKGAFIKVGANSGGYSIGVGNGHMDNNGNEILGLFSAIRWMSTGNNYETGWKFVTLTLNESSLPSIYLNTTLIGSYSGSNPISPTSGIYIGQNTGDGVRAFTGNISQVSIYNRALTASEVQQNFNAARGRFGL